MTTNINNNNNNVIFVKYIIMREYARAAPRVHVTFRFVFSTQQYEFALLI